MRRAAEERGEVENVRAAGGGPHEQARTNPPAEAGSTATISAGSSSADRPVTAMSTGLRRAKP